MISEPSTFRKAFKKWLGVTPKEYRERPFSTVNRYNCSGGDKNMLAYA